MLRIIFLTTFAALVLAQSTPEKILQPKVVGGAEARPNSWPWQASLQIIENSRYAHVCGGVLIRRQWVLTAAHCVDGITISRVVLGEHDQTTYEGKEQYLRVKYTYIHPNWDSEIITNDIALILLSSMATLNSYVSLANLPSAGQIPMSSWTCYITGWGRIQTNGPLSTVLKEAYLPVKAIPTCRSLYGPSVEDTMVCAGGAVNSGCDGDSGGPLNCKVGGQYVVHGLASFVSAKGCNKLPTVFTRVSAFVGWIKCITG